MSLAPLPLRARRVLEALEAGAPVPAAEAAWLADGIRKAPAGGPWARALGMVRRGGVSAREAEALELRDERLWQWRRKHLPGASDAHAAAEMARQLKRANRSALHMAEPRVRELVAAVQAAGREPGERRLREILAGRAKRRLNGQPVVGPSSP